MNELGQLGLQLAEFREFCFDIIEVRLGNLARRVTKELGVCGEQNQFFYLLNGKPKFPAIAYWSMKPRSSGNSFESGLAKSSAIASLAAMAVG